MRIRCLVPFCTHTRGDRKGDPVRDGMEWICGEHWMALPKVERRVYSRVRRRLVAANATGQRVDSPDGTWWVRFRSKQAIAEHARACLAFDRVWSRMKRAAIERAAGI